MPMSLVSSFHLDTSEDVRYWESRMEPISSPSSNWHDASDCRGMEHLHEQGIVHRELKSRNIHVAPSDIRELRDQGFEDVKVTDFGMAKVVDGNLSMPTVLQGVGNSTPWRAPKAYICGLPIIWKKVTRCFRFRNDVLRSSDWDKTAPRCLKRTCPYSER